jgi:hypothetical protein
MNAGTSNPSQRFPSTHWTNVYLASAHEQEAGWRALAELLNRYRPALLQYLAGRYSQVAAAELEDWVSAFIHQKVLQQQLLRNAHKDKGRFRNYVLTALYNFAEDQRRKGGRGKRQPAGGVIPFEAVHDRADLAAPGTQNGGDMRWAVQVIEQARDRTERFYRDKGRADTWMVFLDGCYLPLYHGQARPSDSELAQRHGFEAARQVANAITNAKRRFGHILREVVREYECSESLVDGEIRDLIAIVSDGG